MPSYFDDAQSTNSSEFGFTNSNSSRIWSSTGLSSSLTKNANDRDKTLILNHSGSTTTTTGSGSPYYPSGLFNTLTSSPSSPSNIDNNGNGNGNLNGSLKNTTGNTSYLNVNSNSNSNAPNSINNFPLNLNARNANSITDSPLDRLMTGKFSNQMNSSSPTLNSLNLDKMNVSSGSLNNINNGNGNLTKNSYGHGHQAFMNSANANAHGLAHPQLHHQHPHQQREMHVDHQYSHNHPHAHMQSQHQPQPSHSAPHVQLQPRQHLPEHLTSVMQGMHISTGHGHNPMHSIMDPLEDVLGPFPCVCLRNLPYDVNLQEVLQLLQGLVLLDVVIVPTPGFSHGHAHQTGEAYVLFATPLESQMALQRSGLYLRSGGMQIDIFQGKRNDYYAAIASARDRASGMHGGEHQHGHGQHRSDLSHSTAHPHGHQDSQGSSWSGQGPSYGAGTVTGGNMHASSQMGMHQGQGSRGGGPAKGQGQGNMNAGGNANYKIPQAVAGSGAAFSQHMSKGANARSGRGEGRKSSAGRGSGRGGGIQVGEHTGYLRMRGLPFASTKKEIFDFFNAYDPVEESICLTYRSDGRATGEGYIVFATPENAKEAMALHRNSMGSRYIELFISNKEEHGRALAREPSITED